MSKGVSKAIPTTDPALSLRKVEEFSMIGYKMSNGSAFIWQTLFPQDIPMK